MCAACGGAEVRVDASAGGGQPAGTLASEAAASTVFAPESVPVFVDLVGAASDPLAELSGLAWDGDTLLMVPQFPDRLDTPCLFAVERSALASSLGTGAAVEPRCVLVDLDGVEQLIEGYEGFEALVVDGDEVTLAIEVRETPMRMRGALVRGTLHRNDSGQVERLRLRADSVLDLATPAAIANKAYEALVQVDGGVLALFELATPRFVDPPVATLVTGWGGAYGETVSVPVAPIVGRWTDATAPDARGHFFVVNYVWPGDVAIVEDAADDALASEWGRGPTHAASDAIERIVEMRFDGQAVTRVDRAPTWLQLDADAEPRNWEGIARWTDDAVVMVTDRFPGTRLAVVPLVVGPGRLGGVDSEGEPR